MGRFGSALVARLGSASQNTLSARARRTLVGKLEVVLGLLLLVEHLVVLCLGIRQLLGRLGLGLHGLLARVLDLVLVLLALGEVLLGRGERLLGVLSLRGREGRLSEPAVSGGVAAP
jgi:hypothetical protein